MIIALADINKLEPILFETGTLPDVKYHLFKNNYEVPNNLEDLSKLKIKSVLINNYNWCVTEKNPGYLFESSAVTFKFNDTVSIRGYYATNVEETEIYWLEEFFNIFVLQPGDVFSLSPRAVIDGINFEAKQINPYQWFDIKLCKEKHDPLQAVSS